MNVNLNPKIGGWEKYVSNCRCGNMPHCFCAQLLNCWACKKRRKMKKKKWKNKIGNIFSRCLHFVRLSKILFQYLMRACNCAPKIHRNELIVHAKISGVFLFSFHLNKFQQQQQQKWKKKHTFSSFSIELRVLFFRLYLNDVPKMIKLY